MMQYNLDEYIHSTKLKKEEPIRQTKEASTRVYTFSGTGSPKLITDNSDNAFAKEVKSNNQTFYYVKVAKIGHDLGKMPSPGEMEFKKGGKASQQIGGIKVYQWQTVKKEVFDSYLNYLITGEKKWLRLAHSEMK